MRPFSPLVSAFGLLAVLPMTAGSSLAGEIPQLVPSYRSTQTVVASSDSSGRNYLAFPIVLRLSPDELLIGHKRGYSHYRDREADFDILRFNPVTSQTVGARISLHKAKVNLQNGEFVRFPNGEIACYVDAQAPGNPANSQTVRLGLLEFRSGDGGCTFQGGEKLGVIDGVEYGYAFEAVTQGTTTRMLVMTFSNLTGGRSVYVGRPAAGSVSVIRSEDNGKTWHFVKDLSRAFGNHPINESSFVPCGEGYIVTCRGYDDRQWLLLTDGEFNVKRQVDLVDKYPSLRTCLGRPRLFARDGRFYLMGRNYTAPAGNQASATRTETQGKRKQQSGPMRLGLFRLDPETFDLAKHVILDNAEGAHVPDGYYAAPYWQERDGRTFFEVITYKRTGDRGADILRLTFEWNEVR